MFRFFVALPLHWVSESSLELLQASLQTWLWSGAFLWDWSGGSGLDQLRKLDVIRSDLRQGECGVSQSQSQDLTSRSDSSPTRSFPSRLAGTPNEGSQPSWWYPASKPHCQFPEGPVRSVFSNISSSKLVKHSLSTSTSFKIVGTLVSCASQAFWRIFNLNLPSFFLLCVLNVLAGSFFIR